MSRTSQLRTPRLLSMVVSKTAEEHVEKIHDTIRKIEVDINRDTDVERTDLSRGATDKRADQA
jgi:stress response protein YsnF